MEESLGIRKTSSNGGRAGGQFSGPKIEGNVVMNRKQAWVKRYAKIENRVFSYRKEKRDHQNRFIVDLRDARVRFSNT